ncbi:MAG: diaminopimelate decarboxylase family protein, partial [Bacilli bacterium]
MLEHQIVDNELIIDGVNVKDLAREFKTPLYVISYTRLKEQIQELKEHFQDKYENVKVHYASKANLSVGLAKIMNANNFGLDVVSAGELYIAKCAGVNVKNIEFHGNNKTRESISMGISYEIGYFVCDNEYELHLINEIAQEQNKVQDILFRLTPEVSGGAHDFINTG